MNAFLSHFMDFVRTPAGVLGLIGLAVVLVGLVVDYVLAGVLDLPKE